MRDTFLQFSKPSITEPDIQSVNEVLRSGWITTGAKSATFEQCLKTYTGAKFAVCMNSETSVMQTLIQALDLKNGDEVITPSMTWVSMPNLVSLAKATPRFVDCDRDTLMIRAEDIEQAITPCTKLIVPVHFAGIPLDMDPIRKVASKYNIPLIEDGAHILGGAYKGMKIGATGSVLFSFHPIKNITTGEGGMLVTDDEALAKRVLSLRFHGLGTDAYDRQTNQRKSQAEVLEPGFKCNLPDILATIGVSQMERLDEMNKKRENLYNLYIEALESIDEIIPQKLPDYNFQHAYHLMIVRLDIDKVHISRDEFMERLKKRNIGTGIHFRAVHQQKYYREQFPSLSLPNTEWNSERIFSLPLFPDMQPEDVTDVVEAIRYCLKYK